MSSQALLQNSAQTGAGVRALSLHKGNGENPQFPSKIIKRHGGCWPPMLCLDPLKSRGTVKHCIAEIGSSVGCFFAWKKTVKVQLFDVQP